MSGYALIIRAGLAGLVAGSGSLSARAEPAAAFREISFESRVLQRTKTVSVVIPAHAAAKGGALPVVFLLHGRGRNHHSLLDDPRSRALLEKVGFVVVLPDGEDGWYVNSPVAPADRYGDYLEEVLALVQKKLPVSADPARRAITGWSMGGFGAVSFAEAHPGGFGAVAPIIGLLDFPRVEDLPAGQNYKVPVARFGAEPAVWRQFNPIERVERLRGARLLVITGTEAFDHTMNRNFIARARAAGLEPEFRELPGGHTLDTVIVALPLVFRFFEEYFSGAAPTHNR